MAGIKRQSVIATALTISLFAVWGFASRIHDLVAPQFHRYFQLNDIQAQLSYSSFALSYVFLAIPAAIFLRRFGYKLGLVMGLAMLSLGAFLLYPAVTHHAAFYYVAAVIATGSGWAFLETSANPLILTMGREENAIQRLNLAQTFYPVGLMIAFWLGRQIVVPPSQAANVQFLEANVRPYIVVGLVVLMLGLIIENVEFPRAASQPSDRNSSARKEIIEVWERPEFRFALAAMSIYMTGLAILWSTNAPYARHVFPAITRDGLLQFSLCAWTACALGRACGTALMFAISPARLLTLFTAAACLCAGLALVTPGYFGVIALFGTSFFIGIAFPTIFGMAVAGLGHLTKMASSLLVIAAGLGACIGMEANSVLIGFGVGYTKLAATVLLFGFVFVFSRYSERLPADRVSNAKSRTHQQAMTAR